MPTESFRRSHGTADMPIERPLDRPNIVDPCLHLDDDKRGRCLMEREDVDPAEVSAIRDADLTLDLPSGSDETTLDVRGADGVGRIGRARRCNLHRSASDDVDLDVKRF
jgi:hypothetical protein